MSSGSIFAEAIEKSGLSRRQFAAQLGCDHSHLARVLSGDERLGPKTIGRSLRLLDVETGKQLVKAYLAEQEEQIYAFAWPGKRSRKR